MIETSKYKKGVIALSNKVAKINPRLGFYTKHFINEQAKFVVFFSNGKIIVDIDLARDCEENPNLPLPQKLQHGMLTSKKAEVSKEKSVDSLWNQLFSKRKI